MSSALFLGFKTVERALSGVAQWAGGSTHNGKVVGWIPGQGAYLGCRFDP